MDKAPTIILVLILLGLLLVIAFSSGTEVAMLSVNRYRIRHRAQTGERRARLLEKLLEQPDRWLGANLVILALASVAASTVAALLALRAGQAHALVAEMVLLTVVIIVCVIWPPGFSPGYEVTTGLDEVAGMGEVLLAIASATDS